MSSLELLLENERSSHQKTIDLYEKKIKELSIDLEKCKLKIKETQAHLRLYQLKYGHINKDTQAKETSPPLIFVQDDDDDNKKMSKNHKMKKRESSLIIQDFIALADDENFLSTKDTNHQQSSKRNSNLSESSNPSLFADHDTADAAIVSKIELLNNISRAMEQMKQIIVYLTQQNKKLKEQCHCPTPTQFSKP
ncbi:hypothetical protein RFI_35070 [Reticulomyxa filosa]|uniref:Uncharacterized protein n=1 Tax=Reticulomyxa filosa TaxID=46433 RepID=X6LLA0_RETFI|nr:hypothetical protein RFI_35070 [Reticulomyxa filosa]|eukprot:ETO02364.1 hypothetical protein RFI_35070 [Reticulomyxa filosa]